MITITRPATAQGIHQRLRLLMFPGFHCSKFPAKILTENMAICASKFAKVEAAFVLVFIWLTGRIFKCNVDFSWKLKAFEI